MWSESERHRTMVRAHRARTRGDDRRAIALYRRILREEPDHFEVALKLAPLLARRGERFGAWQLYRGAARQLARAKRYKDCLTIYIDACRNVPQEFDVWRLRAELERMLGREETAFETLLTGRAHFVHPHERGQAIALLARARMLEPLDAEVALDLARLYARTDQADAALELLLTLSVSGEASVARRARALQWRITLAPRHAWRWLEAAGRTVLGERAALEMGEERPLTRLGFGSDR